MAFEDNIVGPTRKCDSIERELSVILKDSGSSNLGRLMVVERKMSIPPYGTIPFNGFDAYQWEESHGLNNGWGWKANALIFIKYLISYHHSSGDDSVLELVKSAITNWLVKYSNTDETYPYRFIWHDMGTGERLCNMLIFLAYIHQYVPQWYQEQRALRENILQACFRHAVLLAKDSFYTANTNHGMHQMCQLLLAGTFFDGSAMDPGDAACLGSLTDDPSGTADNWRNQASGKLLKELEFAFTEEGVHVENSPAYHSFVFRTFTSLVQDYPPAILGDLLSETLTMLSQNALEFLCRILRPDKYLPIIGDTELLPVTDGFSVFDGTPAYGWFTYARTGGERGTMPEIVNKVYPKSGYAIFRDRWRAKVDYAQSVHLVVKAGCLSRYHHQQDEGNVLLYALGEDWLIDSGLYSYAPQDPVRRYMRSRAAHNVPLIYPNAQYSQDFNHRFSSWKITNFDEAPDHPFVKMRLEVLENVCHDRSVIYSRVGNRVEVEDVFNCLDGQNRNIVILWHVPLDKEIVVEPDGLIQINSAQGNQMSLKIQTDEKFSAFVAKGRRKDKINSCFSPKFGVLSDSQVIRISFDSVTQLSVSCQFSITPKATLHFVSTRQNRPKHLAILGSCVTRDIFNYTKEGQYKIVDYTARTSLASAFSDKIMSDKSIRIAAITSPSQRRMVNRDINKLYPEILAELNFDLLIVDCIDERFKLYQNSEGALCTVSAELTRSGFKLARDGRYIMSCTDEFFSLWTQGWERLLMLLNEKKCLDKLYINAVNWALCDEAGAIPEQYDQQWITENNNFIERMYSYMRKSLSPEQFMTFPPEMFVGDSGHRWGPSPFHYTKDYYLSALEQIEALAH